MACGELPIFGRSSPERESGTCRDFCASSGGVSFIRWLPAGTRPANVIVTLSQLTATLLRRIDAPINL